MSVTSLEVGRYKRIAVRSGEVWQGGIFRFPQWVQEREDDPPVRVVGAFWLSVRTGLIWAEPAVETEAPGVDLALRAMFTFAKKYERELMGRPSRIEVTDPALADEMRARLSDPATTVVVVPELPAVREALCAFERYETDGEAVTASLLETPGITIDRVRAFADAADRFYRANPWNSLSADHDLIHIESPAIDPAMQYLVVTGSTRDVRGLMFFSTRKAFETFMRHPPGPGRGPKPQLWMVSFDPVDYMPFGDVDVWTDHHLPVSAPDAYPRPGRINGEVLDRPDPKRLAFLDAVLRAVADSTTEDFDAGRWSKRVITLDGDVDVQLSLPMLLDEMVADEAKDAGTPARSGFSPLDLRLDMERAMRRATATPLDAPKKSKAAARKKIERELKAALAGDLVPHGLPPLEQAQDLAFKALASRGRRRSQLARRALAISRDCADAWAVLGSEERDIEKAIPLMREAVAAGERALGPKIFEQEAGHFWGLVHTRPYMRARLALADVLGAAGAHDEEIAIYRDMLRLNPGDNQGVRDWLLATLLELNRNQEAQALIDQFRDDGGADWTYAAALVAFRNGDTGGALLRLADGIKANTHVPAFLLSEREIGDLPDSYRIGSPEEAAIIADRLLDAWESTPGALDWLESHRRLARSRRRR